MYPKRTLLIITLYIKKGVVKTTPTLWNKHFCFINGWEVGFLYTNKQRALLQKVNTLLP